METSLVDAVTSSDTASNEIDCSFMLSALFLTVFNISDIESTVLEISLLIIENSLSPSVSIFTEKSPSAICFRSLVRLVIDDFTNDTIAIIIKIVITNMLAIIKINAVLVLLYSFLFKSLRSLAAFSLYITVSSAYLLILVPIILNSFTSSAETSRFSFLNFFTSSTLDKYLLYSNLKFSKYDFNSSFKFSFS